ncbi:hypothetical protein FGU64_05110 [Mesorhizobium sp. 8]|nr:hypothetical protein FGU64_05110 [Mesorhizobium sp. 8]
MACPFLLPVYGEKVPEGRMRGGARRSEIRTDPHLPAGICPAQRSSFGKPSSWLSVACGHHFSPP